MRNIKHVGILLMALCFIIQVLPARGQAGELSSVAVTASALVPGQESRYTVKFCTDTELDLSKGAVINVELPHEFIIIRDGISAPDPGCTLARLQFKNQGEQAYAVVDGAVDVNRADGGIQISFFPQPRLERLVIPAKTELYLTIPGVVNPSAAGSYNLKLLVHDAQGVEYQGVGKFRLALPPDDAPKNVRVMEATSYKVRLTWDPVPGATRYRVVFSTEPAGQYISALDFNREPLPGEEWQLTETTHSFTGRGNGGLCPGGMYYFKIIAGNEAGFGTASSYLRVLLPEIKLQSRQGEKHKGTVWRGDDIIVRLNQPVKIVDQDAIAVYEKVSREKVKESRPFVDETNNSVVRINAKTKPGLEYLVVFYEGALENKVQPNIVNNTFGWTVAVVDGGRGD